MSKASQLRQKAQSALQKGKVQEAVEIYRKLLQVEPRNPNLHNELGDIFMRSDDRIQAIGSFEQAILNYEKVALYNNAVAVCKKILRVVPDRPETIFKIGELKAKQKFTGEAVAAFTQYFDSLLGEAAQVGEPAMKKAEKALELLPGNEEVGVRASDVLARGGRTTRAAEVLAQVIASAGAGDRTRLYRQRLESLRPSLGGDDLARIDEILASAGPAVEADVPEELVHAAAQTAAAPQAPAAEEAQVHDGEQAPTVQVPPDATEQPPAQQAAPAAQHAGDPSEQTAPADEYVIDEGDDGSPAAEYVIDAEEPEQEQKECAIDTGEDQGADGEYVVEPPAAQEPPAAAAPQTADQATPASPQPQATEAAPEQAQDTAPQSAEPPVAGRQEQEQQGEVPTAPGPARGATVSEDLSDILDAEDAAMEEAQNVASSITEEITSDVEEDDYRSHYDLGMAYIEMALYNEAIKELQISSRSEQLQLRSLEMIGHCFLLLQNPRLAVKQLTRGLDIARVSGGDSLGIHYNLGLAYEALGEVEKAREHFEEVYIVDVTFRDISDKMKKYSTVG